MGDLHTNNKKTIITVIIIALAVLAGGTAGLLCTLQGDPAQSTAKVVKAEPEEGKKVKAAETSTLVEFTAVKNKTVLEQLKTRATVAVKDSQYGPYVESINGLAGGTDNKYWSYYVDGQMANIGAGKYVTKGGEKIVWKFE